MIITVKDVGIALVRQRLPAKKAYHYVIRLSRPAMLGCDGVDGTERDPLSPMCSTICAVGLGQPPYMNPSTDVPVGAFVKLHCDSRRSLTILAVYTVPNTSFSKLGKPPRTLLLGDGR